MKDRKNSSLLRRLEKFQRLFFVALLSVLAVGAFAQSKTVSGTVLDKTGESVIGASVVVKGTTNGTITDFDGKFTLQNVPDNGTIQVSFVGYKTVDIQVKGQSTVKIILEEDTETLDEVVVVGYGVQKKSDVTGAMARVGEKELKSMPVKNALEGMQGKTAGVDITSSQRPGEVGDINIRGVRSIKAEQSPLYVVDGMVIQNGGIENINPSDIESIDILKDASATAIYGSRGANGVILVTTKKGKEGRVTLNYSGSVTFETLHDVTDMMSASEWLDYARLAKYNMGAYGNRDAAFAPSYEADRLAFGGVAASWANIDQAWSNGNYDLRIRKFIEWTEKSHRKFSQKIEVTPNEITITPLDEQFIEKAIKIVEERMSDSDFSVEMLGAELGLSRSHLYKKLMCITGKGPAEFIRIIRLKRSKQLLKESQKQIAEIAYEVGFSSPKRFTVNFKNEFGISPSDYIRSLK